jgi:hypothetical protein
MLFLLVTIVCLINTNKPKCYITAVSLCLQMHLHLHIAAIMTNDKRHYSQWTILMTVY